MLGRGQNASGEGSAEKRKGGRMKGETKEGGVEWLERNRIVDRVLRRRGQNPRRLRQSTRSPGPGLC